MKRIHIGLDVQDLNRSIAFYSNLFGAEPSLRKDDYAKWMLDDPRVNFSITARDCAAGDIHFGIQVENEGDLADIAGRLKQAGEAVLDEPDTTCCYHKSEKAWVLDPENHRWETFFTTGLATTYGDNSLALEEMRAAKAQDPKPAADERKSSEAAACCTPN